MGKTRKTVVQKERGWASVASEPPALPVAAPSTEGVGDALMAVSNPLVLEILTVLAAGGASMDEIVQATSRPRYLLSMYLGDLCRSGIAARDGQGDSRRYRLVDVRIRAILAGLAVEGPDLGHA